MPRRSQVGEDDLLEVDLVELPAGVVDVPVGAHEQRRLALGVALADHVVNARDGCRVAARAGEEAVAREDLVDRPGKLEWRPGEDHEVVADPFEVGDDVRGEHDRHARLGDGLHHRLEELAAGERVERGDRLVEQQQLGPLGEASVSAT